MVAARKAAAQMVAQSAANEEKVGATMEAPTVAAIEEVRAVTKAVA
jgi:hypothetical protein